MLTACLTTYGLSVDCMNRSLKQAVNEHSARGGGKQQVDGQRACGRPEASVHIDANVLGQVPQWVFLDFHIHLHQHDAVGHIPCVRMASLESVPHSPPPFLTSLFSSCSSTWTRVNGDMLGMLTATLGAAQNMQLIVHACMRVNLCIPHSASWPLLGAEG